MKPDSKRKCYKCKKITYKADLNGTWQKQGWICYKCLDQEHK